MKTIYQCPDCGSREVHESKWCDVNSGEIQPGEGPLQGRYCLQCKCHVEGLDRVYGPHHTCEACANPKWDSPIPIEGAFVDAESGAITRCDDCALFDSDEDAAYALSAEMTRRGFSGYVRAYVNEYEPGEMGEYGPNYFGPDYPVPKADT